MSEDFGDSLLLNKLLGLSNSRKLPEGIAAFIYVGHILGGVHLSAPQKAVLAEIANQASTFGNWREVTAEEIATRQNLSLTDVLVALHGLQEAGLIDEPIAYRGKEYILPTKDGARFLWLAYQDQHLVLVQTAKTE